MAGMTTNRTKRIQDVARPPTPEEPTSASSAPTVNVCNTTLGDDSQKTRVKD